jgi:diacylglycerol kinase family enzyme
MDGPLALIVNPAAGGGRAAAALPAVEAELARLGMAFQTQLTASLEHAEALARAAVDAGETVVVLSGDGLLGRVAGVLSGSPTPLGILPGGRGNDFARVLGISADPVQACATLAGGHVREVDVGDVGGLSFIGIASCGFDSDANRIANEAKLVKGNLVYAYGARRASSWSSTAAS